MIESNSTDLIEHQKVSTICENVEQAKLEVKQAFEILRSAKNRLRLTLGDSSVYHDILPSSHRHYGDAVFDERSETEVYDHITRNAWRYIMDQTGLRHYMTERRQKELDEQIQKNDLPPLSSENIMGTLQGLHGRLPDLLDESIKEVFDWLTPHEHSWRAAYKTNKLWRIGPKVITYGMRASYSSGMEMNSYQRANWTALGNVFSLLDGKGVQRYPDDLYTRFNSGRPAPGDLFTDDYFEIRAYANGNAHIKFKRLDLVKKLNQAAGGMDLPGQEKV
jgi:Domain of unknown function (DUF4942)